MENKENGQKPHNVTIVVHDEDTGKNPIQLKATSADSVQTFIDKLYEALRTSQKPDDRLRCGKSEINVFTFAALNIVDFLREHCAAHEWVFAGATGGALCLRRP